MENKQIEVSSKIGEWYVDFQKNDITWKIDPSVKVPLADDFFDVDKYVFAFDLSNRKLSDNREHTLVKIPQLLNASDACRQEFIEQYGLKDVDLYGLSDKQAKMRQPALQERLKKSAVTIDIAGQVYEVDFPEHRFCPVNKSSGVSISFEDVLRSYNHDGNNCIFLLQKEDHRIAKVIDETVIAVEIPHPALLDPVGLSQVFKINLIDAIMNSGPLKNHHVAKTMSLDSNGDMKIIKSEKKTNRRRLGR